MARKHNCPDIAVILRRRRSSAIEQDLWLRPCILAFCMAWLDKQAPCSVLLTSYDTIAILETIQLEELCHGLCSPSTNLSSGVEVQQPKRQISCPKNYLTNATSFEMQPRD
ncbi:hypothetical protein VPH35_034184 [Triticum aestivum]|uniref:Uncharacterized protein n=1 Tax=Aegilops tauschii TaxID=37682 RepID=M8BVM0_AEGTA